MYKSVGAVELAGMTEVEPSSLAVEVIDQSLELVLKVPEGEKEVFTKTSIHPTSRVLMSYLAKSELLADDPQPESSRDFLNRSGERYSLERLYMKGIGSGAILETGPLFSERVNGVYVSNDISVDHLDANRFFDNKVLSPKACETKCEVSKNAGLTSLIDEEFAGATDREQVREEIRLFDGSWVDRGSLEEASFGDETDSELINVSAVEPSIVVQHVEAGLPVQRDLVAERAYPMHAEANAARKVILFYPDLVEWQSHPVQVRSESSQHWSVQEPITVSDSLGWALKGVVASAGSNLAVKTTAGTRPPFFDSRMEHAREATALGKLDGLGDISAARLSSEHFSSIAQVSQNVAASNGRFVLVQIWQHLPKQGGHSVEVKLCPEELGSVRMTISLSDGVASLAVVADRTDTLDLLRRHADQLEQEYLSLGFSGVDLSFEQSDRSTDEEVGSSQDRQDAIQPDTVVIRQATPTVIAALSGLDIRL
jgi:hypothetical protein